MLGYFPKESGADLLCLLPIGAVSEQKQILQQSAFRIQRDNFIGCSFTWKDGFHEQLDLLKQVNLSLYVFVD